MIKKIFIKTISLLLVIGLNWAGISAIGSTWAYFNDTETASENSYIAGTLDFSLRDANDNLLTSLLFNISGMQKGESQQKIVRVKNDGVLDFQYKASLANVSGDLCNYLTLKAELDGNTYYNSVVQNTSFPTDPVVFSLPDDDWTFTLTLSNGAPESKTCAFDFVFDGAQISGAGFSDQEIISNTIASGQWLISPDLCLKINEVYYDPDSQRGDADDEWIEFYNACGYTVNLKNWYLRDNNAIETIHSSYDVGAGQFVVIAANASTWEQYWRLIPENAVKIALGGQKMFNGLNNDGDEVFLYDNQKNKIDAVSWGTDKSAFEPPVSDVGKGHSIARKIKGVDTDTANDWEDLTEPNPGTNPHSISFSTPVNTESVPAFESATAVDSANLAETATAAEEEIFREEPATPAIEENVAEEKEPLSEEMPAEEALVIEEQPVDTLNDNLSEQNSAQENNGNNKENEDASDGETNTNDDMPIKNDDNSTEIIFSI